MHRLELQSNFIRILMMTLYICLWLLIKMQKQVAQWATNWVMLGAEPFIIHTVVTRALICQPCIEHSSTKKQHLLCSIICMQNLSGIIWYDPCGIFVVDADIRDQENSDIPYLGQDNLCKLSFNCYCQILLTKMWNGGRISYILTTLFQTSMHWTVNTCLVSY